MELKTLALIKPDGVEKGLIGEVIKRIEETDIDIIAMIMLQLTLDQAKEFYAVHKDSRHYKDLTEFTASGPLVVMLLEGENVIERWRSMMGATDSSKAEKGTIRGDLGSKTVIRENVVHGSDSPESAEFEINLFFART
jgi:nucleoside-diphosphate kinase